METGRVSVTGFGMLKEHLGKDTTVPAGQTAAQAVESLRLGSAGGLPVTPVVNGAVVAWDYLLQPGDKLQLMPTLGGGCLDTTDLAPCLDERPDTQTTRPIIEIHRSLQC